MSHTGTRVRQRVRDREYGVDSAETDTRLRYADQLGAGRVVGRVAQSGTPSPLAGS